MRSTYPPYRLLVLALIGCLCLTGSGLSAQHGVPPGFLDKVPVTSLPAQDNDRLLREELAARGPGRPDVFAVSIPTTLRPENSGTWVDRGGSSSWYLRVASPGAKSLNLGFSEYLLPEGAELHLSTEDEHFGPFTAADNADHNQLWTPLLLGDELLVELRVPTAKKKGLRLYLTSVNHDFADVTKSLSGSCNLDVICNEADGWGIVDAYRDIIRSVGAYTLNGVVTCTGFLVNNVNEDGTPFFMTANHCGINGDNDQSLVAYWNYESPTCRQPNSPASGETNPGSRDIFNTGARLLANTPSSDMALTVLEEPVVPEANAFYAGWSRSNVIPTDTVIAIHHPAVEEKRISFSFNEIRRTTFDQTNNDPDGRYIVVSSWSTGTTEGGSSGSPLFDRQKRVRGQLFGGNASCAAPDEYDQYGFFTSSWEGDGTPETGLRAWLDPCGMDLMEIDGFDSSEIPFVLSAATYCKEVCAGGESDYLLEIGSGFPDGSKLVVLNSVDGINTTLSAGTVAGGGTATMSVSTAAGLADGSYDFRVEVSGGGRTDEIVITVNSFDAAPAAPALFSPAPDATDVSPLIAFNWQSTPGDRSYDFELSTSADFSEIVGFGTGLPDTELTLGSPLDAALTYHWRVRANNACGPGAWSTGSFTTEDQACLLASSDDDGARVGPNNGDVTMAIINIEEDVELEVLEVGLNLEHTFVGDLDAILIHDGDTVVLFNSPQNGNCDGADMDVVFSTTAAATANDFETSCPATQPSFTGAYQPAGSFAPFLGKSARGKWTLLITDNANQDGGQLNDFTLTYCGVDKSTSVHDLGQDRSLAIFPNPAREFVTVALTGDWPGDIEGRLYDVAGRSLREYRFSGGDRTNWDVSQLPAGMYFLRVRAGNQDFTERIVIAR